MATRYYIGNAKADKQLETLTVGGTIETTDVFNVTINGKTISVVGGSATADNVATAIANAINDSTYPEFSEVRAVAVGSSSGQLTVESKVAGRPFTLSIETTETGGGAADDQTFTKVTTTANKGPNVVNDVDNWDGQTSLPTGSDDIVFDQPVDVLYELDHFAAVAFSSVTVTSRFINAIGLPERNAGGYDEYRPTHLQLGATVLKLGTGQGAGSGRLKFDLQSNLMTATVFNSGSPIEDGIKSVLLKSTNTSSAVTVHGGSVGIATFPGEQSTIALTQHGGDVELGSGVTLDDVDKTGGTLRANGVATQASKTITLA